MRIINVPIEPLEERYSEQWAKWFPAAFARQPMEYFDIQGEALTTGITRGAFLDVCGTNYYKASQLMQIIEGLHAGEIGLEGDCFLFHDLWFPGLEMLAYVRDALELKFKITGIMHAGTYDPFDFLSKQGMGSWGVHLERAWFSFVDKVFVATEFHKRLLLTSGRDIFPSSKIAVTGLPINVPFSVYGWAGKLCTKEDLFVFPHRLDSEKNPHLFDRLEKELSASEYNFLKTKDVWGETDFYSAKENYYFQLRSAKVALSFAEQETWGIAMQEALFAGCVPLVPDRLSYSEMYLDMFRYSTWEECVKKAKYFMENYWEDDVQNALVKNCSHLLLSGQQAIPNMIDRIKGLCNGN